MRADRTEIERWIHEEFSPVRTTTAELAYERMESQSGECLPVLYEPLDHTKRMHWHDEALCAAIARALGGAGRVLDVGPGDGWPSLRIADRLDEVVGIDPSPRRVRVQRENAARLDIANVEFLEMDAVSLDFPDSSFDGVVAASVIEQTEDPERALEEVFRVLRPGGRFVMIFEDYDGYFPDSDGDEEVWAEREGVGGDGDDRLPDESRGSGVVLFYQARTKSPPSERRYALRLSAELLDGAAIDYLDELGESHERVETSPSGEKHRPAALELRSLERLARPVRGATYFEISHLSAGTVGPALARAGFAGARYLDHRLAGVLALYDGVKGEGRLHEYEDSFVELCRKLGGEAVDRAGERPDDFVMCEKPETN